VALLYLAWASAFIMETSVVAIDGKRYFNLFDDAMISMRYAWNFSHGQGLVWNPGEHVEGYTNLLMTLVMSVFTFLLDKSAAVLAVQVLGALLVLGSCYLVWQLSGYLSAAVEPRVRPLFKAEIVLLTLTYYPLSFWALTGMETGMLTVLILGALCLIERPAREGREPDLLLSSGLLGLAYLTRPDSIIFAIPLLAYGIDKVRREDRLDRGLDRLVLPTLVLYLLFPLGQELFRILYYGAYLPNTYYLKLTGMPLIDRIRNGWGFLTIYLVTHALVLGMGALGFGLKPDRRKACYLSLVILPILYEVWVGGDPVRIWRIMAPVQPVAAFLFVFAASEVLRRLGAAISTPNGTRLLGILTAASIVSMNVIFTPQILLRQYWYPEDFYPLRANAAVAINEITTQDASVGVLAAGVVPYYTGREAFDFLGRSDNYIARLAPDLSGAVAWNGMYSVPGHNKYDLTYSIEQLQPTYIDTSHWGRQDLTDWVSAHYEWVTYKGVSLWLKRGAPEVKWGLLAP
jgi:arabinofuranosyltransferase